MKKRAPREYMELLQYPQCLIIDEAHRSGAKQFYEPAVFCKNAYYRIPLTATPFMTDNSADNMYLMGIGGPVASRVSNSELIERGVLARPFFKFFKINGAIPQLKDWHEIYERGIVHHQERNGFIAKQTAKLAHDGKKILVIVNQVVHGKILLDLLKKERVKAKYVDGAASYPEREKALQWLSTTGSVIIATNIFDEGIDVKDINAVVLAAGTKAAPALFQRTGRATRKKSIDNYAIVIDFIDTQHPKLLEHSMRRYNLIKNEKGFTIL
jgi:superfamily II DNA or RNA helicase